MNSKTPGEKRRKFLMKKLERIKLNNSLNDSQNDWKRFYEKKLQKLRLNNISLAKSLSEQRLISASWSKEVIDLKSKLHEKDEKLLKYKHTDLGDYESIINAKVQLRVREAFGPVEVLTQESLTGILKLVENFTKIRSHLASLKRKITREELNTSKGESEISPNVGDESLQPPLTQNLRTPRKNVVHPMVKGHVLLPSTIPLSRVRLHSERSENTEQMRNELDMESENEYTLLVGAMVEEEPPTTNAIPEEESISNVILEEESISDVIPEEESISDVIPEEESISDVIPEEESMSDVIPIEDPTVVAVPEDSIMDTIHELPIMDIIPEEEECVSPEVNKPPQDHNKYPCNDFDGFADPKKNKVYTNYDPGEGPSWLFDKKKKFKRKNRSKKIEQKKSKEKFYNPQLGMFFDNESDLESDTEINVPPNRVSDENSPFVIYSPPKKEVNSPKQIKCSNGVDSILNKSCSPVIPLTRIEELGSRISRRRKKGSQSSIASNRSSLNENLDSLPYTSSPGSNISSPDFLNKGILNIEDKTKETHTFEENGLEKTIIQNLSMEITQCLSPELNSKVVSEVKFPDSLPKASQKKFFSFQEDDISENLNQPQRTPFDISLMDASVKIQPFCRDHLGNNAELPACSVSLKDVSIVMEDILKDLPKEECLDASPTALEANKENTSPKKKSKGTRKERTSVCPPIRKSRRVPAKHKQDDYETRSNSKRKTRNSSEVNSEVLNENSDNLLQIQPEDIIFFNNELKVNIKSEAIIDLENDNLPVQIPELNLKGDDVIPLEMNDPLEIKEEDISILEDVSVDIINTAGRSRRAASQGISFKEPSISRKLRQGDNHSSSIYKNFIPTTRKKASRGKKRSKEVGCV